MKLFQTYVSSPTLLKIFSPILMRGMPKSFESIAYLTSMFSNAVLDAIWDNPAEVAYFFDGAECPENILNRHLAMFDKTRSYERVGLVKPARDDLGHYGGYWLMNLTKKECVCMSDYIERNTSVVIAETAEPGQMPKPVMHLIAPDPLAILTAVGLDSPEKELDLVGRWAYDTIELICPPVGYDGDGYTDITRKFK